MTTQDTIIRYFQNILLRAPTTEELASAANDVDGGSKTLTQVRDSLASSDEAVTYVDQIIRIYQAAFNRLPDITGMQGAGGDGGWPDQLRADPTTLFRIAEGFTNSQEFANIFGGNTVSIAFLTALYTNVLGRAASTTELNDWINTGQTASQILIGFSNSAEFQTKTATAVLALKKAAGDATDLATAYNGTDPLGSGGDEIQSFTLTTGTDDFTGGELATTFVGNNTTLTSGDTLDGGSAYIVGVPDTLDTFLYTSSGTARVTETGLTTTGIEVFKITAGVSGSDPWTEFSFANVNTNVLLNIHSVDSSSNLIVQDLAYTTGVYMTNVTGGDFSVLYNAGSWDGTNDLQGLILNNVMSDAGSAASSFYVSQAGSGSGGLEELSVVTEGSESKLASISSFASSITIAGDQDLQVTDALDGATSINASGFTGDLSVVTDSAGTDKDVVVTGGSGFDIVDFSAGLEKGDVFNGGAGTDRVQMTYDQARDQSIFALDNAAELIDVEELMVTTTDGGSSDILFSSGRIFEGIATVYYEGGSNRAISAGDVRSGMLFNVNYGSATPSNSNNRQINLDLEDSGGSLSIAINNLNVSTTISDNTNANRYEKIAANDTGTLSLAANDYTSDKSATLRIDLLEVSAANRLEFYGNAAIRIDDFKGEITIGPQSIVDASNMTDSLVVSQISKFLFFGGSTISLGSGSDIFMDGTGFGADTITTGAGSDEFRYTSVSQSTTGNVDVYTDFDVNNDKFSFQGLSGGSGFVGNYTSISDAQAALDTTNVKAVFVSSTNTLWVDVNKDKVLDSNDFQVILTGVDSVSSDIFL